MPGPGQGKRLAKPVSSVLVDYLIDLPRTPWPGPDSNASRSTGFVCSTPRPCRWRALAIPAKPPTWNLYYTGSVVTDITANVTDSQGTFGVTNTVGISAGEILYINHEAVQVFSIDPGTSSIGVFRAQEGTTATSPLLWRLFAKG